MAISLTKSNLVKSFGHVRANLVFLNACRSAALATYLSDLGVPVVSAWTKPVLDIDGMRTAVYFYDELAENPDLREAYKKVTPRDGSLLFVTSEGYISELLAPLIQKLDNVGRSIAALGQRMAQFTYALVALVVLIAGVGYLAFITSSVLAAEMAKDTNALFRSRSRPGVTVAMVNPKNAHRLISRLKRLQNCQQPAHRSAHRHIYRASCDHSH